MRGTVLYRASSYVWSLQFLGKGSSNLWVHSLKSLGKRIVLSKTFAGYWASEASPTLGCSIELSRDIYTKYSTLPSGISVYIVLKVGIFPEAGGRGK